MLLLVSFFMHVMQGVIVDYRSKVIAVFNQKGGVGKTTVAAILAEHSAIAMGKTVLIVDLDMQCNSSDYWVGMESAPTSQGGQRPPRHPDYEPSEHIEERSTIADIFYGKSILPYSTFINTENGYASDVDIMLGHPALLEQINTEFSNASGKIVTQIHNRLAEFLHSEDVQEVYDVIILDTGPSRNPVFRGALRAATHAVIPFEPEEKSLQGINAMVQAIESENFSRIGDDDQIKLIGLCPNKVRGNTRLHRTILNSMYKTLPALMYPKDIYIPHSTAIPERDVKGINPRSIFHISKKHPARAAAELVGSYTMNRVFS